MMDANSTEKNSTKIKRSLVRTRDIIKEKFRKLHGYNIKKKRDLEERYHPITSTLQKLIDSKKNGELSQPSVSMKKMYMLTLRMLIC